jgi:outer membrane receptor for ferrienterochelin and colicins
MIGLALAALLSVVQDSVGAPSAALTVNAATGAEARSIPGALIVIDGAREPSGRTDARGRWSGTVAAGQRRVRVLAIGYRPRDTVVVMDGGNQVVQVNLTPAIVPLGEIVVTAARREQRLADAVVETELITAEDLKRGPSDLASVLTERVGIQPDGGVPSGTGVQLRGFGSRRVLVLVDGQPLVGRINGTMDLARFPVSAVERIEIVKGPQSTLYGSDAIGGVINVITKSGPRSGIAGGIATMAGTRGQTEISADAGWRRGAMAMAVDGGHQGVDLVSGVSSDNASYSRRSNGSTRIDWHVDSVKRVELGAFAITEQQRYRTGQLFHFGDNVQTSTRLALHNDGAIDKWSATLSGSTFDHLSRAATREVPASDSGSRDRQRLLQGELHWSGARGPGVLDGGVAIRREWIDADRLSQSTSDLIGIEPFAQATLAVGRVLVTPGARVSWSDRWGRFVAPRLAALFRPRENIAIRAALGRGYRAPDFKELYLEFVNAAAGYAVYGNPDLRPERSTSVSLGSEWASATAFLRASSFASDYRDFIETRAPDASGAYTYGNIAKGWTRGLEAEAGVLVGEWRLEAAGERLWTFDAATGQPLLGRTPFALRARGSGPLTPTLSGSLRVAYTARTPISRDSAGGVTAFRDAFPKVDARLSRMLNSKLELSAEVSNILDRRLGANWPGFTGRTASIQLRWRSDSTH